MKQNSDEYYALEYLKCRQNPLYFIYNYVQIPEIGGSMALNKNAFHPKMKRVVRSLVRYNKVILMASRQLGKALDLDTLIPTVYRGYKRFGDLNIGEWIFDDTNSPTQVTNITEIMYNRPCYELKFGNGECIVTDENHEWYVSGKIRTTKELYKLSKSINLDIECYTNNRKELVRILNINITKSVPVRCITVSNENGLFLCTKSKIVTHNSTTAAALLTWAINFFPGIPAIILNMRQVAALENLNKIKFIHSNLPSWMKSPIKGRAEKKTYLELENDSIIRTFYPASTAGPDQIARSLTAPILYIDEVGFIRHIDIAYRAAQPVL